MSCLVVVVNGSSASGKSRLIASVERIAEDAGVLRGVRVAQRTTTRAPREHESRPGENRHLDSEQFHAAVRAGALDVHWKRVISADHQNHYGFALARELPESGLLILPANNYLDWESQPLLMALRGEHRLMVIRVWASLGTRIARLRARRPRITEPELGSRLADLLGYLLPPADHVVPNDPEFEKSAEWEFLRLVAAFRFSSQGDEGQLGELMHVGR
jgi:ribose 1,5-bisphosphokinase PhnN